MANNEVIFKVYYGGRFDRRYRCTYVGGNIGLYKTSYDLDRLSFIKIEIVVKKFGYRPSDLVYYREPYKELDDGLVLLTSNEDVVKMADTFLGEKLVMLYTVSFANVGDEVVCPNVGEGEEGENSGDEERMMKVLNDPYWKAMMSDSDDAWDTVDEPIADPSTRGGETSTFRDDWHDFIDFDEEVVGENDGDSGDEEGAHEEAAQLETTHVGGSTLFW